MKTTFNLFIITMLLMVTTTICCAQGEREKNAIKSLIERETTAFMQIDYKGWMDCWDHVPYAYWSLSDTTGFYTFEGWKAIEIGFTDYFLTSKPNPAKIDRKWLEIRVYGTGAYARFIQYSVLDGVTIAEDELRILEKHDNQWKIVLVGVMKGPQKDKAVN